MDSKRKEKERSSGGGESERRNRWSRGESERRRRWSGGERGKDTKHDLSALLATRFRSRVGLREKHYTLLGRYLELLIELHHQHDSIWMT